MKFKQYLEVNTDWFKQAIYKINNQDYQVSQIADWAKKNLSTTQIAISEIEKRYIWAKNLFIDVDDPNDDWGPRSMNTDLSFPILMLQYPNGKWEIIDGNHRTWKAWKSGMKSINGYLILSDKLPPSDQLQHQTT